MTTAEDLRQQIRTAVGEAIGSGEGLDDVEAELEDALDRIDAYRRAMDHD